MNASKMIKRTIVGPVNCGMMPREFAQSSDVCNAPRYTPMLVSVVAYRVVRLIRG